MKDTIRIAGVVKESIVDGPGLRFAVFTQGCAHHCPECQNPETWDFEGGYDCGIDKILKAMDENPLLDGITMSGGDPLYQAEASYSLCSKVKEKGLNVVVFTGYTYEELMELEKKDPELLRNNFIKNCNQRATQNNENVKVKLIKCSIKKNEIYSSL